MTALGFCWVLGRAFRDELALLARTERSWAELDAVRRARLAQILRATGGWGGSGDVQAVLVTLPAAERGAPAPGGLWRRLTSGSSGRAVEVPVGRATYARMLAGFWRGMGWWGVAPGEPGFAALGASGPAFRHRLVRAKDRALGVRRVIVDDGRPWLDEARALLQAHAYVYVYGYPSALYELAAAGVAPRRPPRVAVTTGEPLFHFQRQAIQEAFGAPVAEEFGCTELGTVAFECPRGSLHLTAEQVWLERVGSQALATSLVPRPSPLVRHPLDEAVVEERGRCPCGLALPRVTLVRRRDEVWRRFEEATRQAAARAGLPARFSVSLQGTGLVRVPLDAPGPQVESLAAAVGPGTRVERTVHLLRRAAGKFSYLEGEAR